MKRPCPEVEREVLKRVVVDLSPRQFDAWIELDWKICDFIGAMV
jgi:hypothetical protein